MLVDDAADDLHRPSRASGSAWRRAGRSNRRGCACGHSRGRAGRPRGWSGISPVPGTALGHRPAAPAAGLPSRSTTLPRTLAAPALRVRTRAIRNARHTIRIARTRLIRAHIAGPPLGVIVLDEFPRSPSDKSLSCRPYEGNGCCARLRNREMIIVAFGSLLYFTGGPALVSVGRVALRLVCGQCPCGAKWMPQVGCQPGGLGDEWIGREQESFEARSRSRRESWCWDWWRFFRRPHSPGSQPAIRGSAGG